MISGIVGVIAFYAGVFGAKPMRGEPAAFRPAGSRTAAS